MVEGGGHINRKKILTGALTLTAAGVITRVLGFVYRIYMSNLMGAEGMGLYQLRRVPTIENSQEMIN